MLILLRGILPMGTSRVSLCHYRYSALDLLTVVEPAGQPSLQRFYCPEHVATELQGAASRSVFQHGAQLLGLQSRNGVDLNGQLLVTDQQRSVLQVCDSGASVQQAYSPYGHRRVEGGVGSVLGFNGEVFDPVTGHYPLGHGHRVFNPVLMRFNSPDRLSPFGRGGLNPYAYCMNDPVNFSDPTGRFINSLLKIITSAGALFNSAITLKPGIPFEPALGALANGGIFVLPARAAAGAVSSVLAGVSGVAGAGVGLASTVVAAINPALSLLGPLAHTAVGLMGVSVAGRFGSYWAARSSWVPAAIRNLANPPPLPLHVGTQTAPVWILRTMPEPRPSTVLPSASRQPTSRRFGGPPMQQSPSSAIRDPDCVV